AGHSPTRIGRNLDVIAASDWIIDLGPEGGEGGGAVVVEGPPEAVRTHASSHTGAALRDYAQALGKVGDDSRHPADAEARDSCRSGASRDSVFPGDGADGTAVIAACAAPTGGERSLVAAEPRVEYRPVAAP